MSTSYSDHILQALAKHGRLNTPQLAAKISCDTKKATQLVSFMRMNKKIKTDGPDRRQSRIQPYGLRTLARPTRHSGSALDHADFAR